MSQLKTILADLNQKLAKAEEGLRVWQEDVNRIRAAIALISSYDAEPKKLSAPKAKVVKAKVVKATKEVKEPAASKVPKMTQDIWINAITEAAAETGSASPAAIAEVAARQLSIKGDASLRLLKSRASPALAAMVEKKKIKKVGEGLYAPA